MKDEYLKAYQQRIEEIKLLDVSPKEKRKLAADAKNEILDQYKASYINEKKGSETTEEVAAQEPETVSINEALQSENQAQTSSQEAPEQVSAEEDPIGNILNKLEEREERGEVGVELETPTEFMDPDALFATMNLDELFSSLGIEDDEDEQSMVIDTDIDEENIDDIFMDSDDLFAGLLDEVEDEINSEVISEQFDIEENDEELVPNKAISEQTEDVFNAIVGDEAEQSVEEVVEVQPEAVIEVLSEQVVTQTVDTLNFKTVETEVEEVEELVEGSIIDDQDDIETLSDEELEEELVDGNLPRNIDSEELEELEKERERAQKIGIIEIILLVILIVLIAVVVYVINRGV